jgi:CBS domain-containing protein
MITASQLMTPDLVTVPLTASVRDAADLMKERKIGSVFVEQSGHVVGIVTETDIIRDVVSAGYLPHKVLVRDIMSSPVIGIDEKRPITEAADLMERNGTRHLAVMSYGAIVGVLSVRDLLRPVAVDEF